MTNTISDYIQKKMFFFFRMDTITFKKSLLIYPIMLTPYRYLNVCYLLSKCFKTNFYALFKTPIQWKALSLGAAAPSGCWPHGVNATAPYPCVIGWSCRITWVLGLPSSPFTITTSPTDTASSASAIASSPGSCRAEASHCKATERTKRLLKRVPRCGVPHGGSRSGLLPQQAKTWTQQPPVSFTTHQAGNV